MTIAAGTTPFRDEPVPQYDLSTRRWRKNCVPAATACNIGRATLGRIRRTAKAIRAAAGVFEDRGMSYGEAVIGTIRTTGRTLTPVARYGIPNGDVTAFVDGGHSVVASIDAGTTVNTKQSTNEYAGPHSIGLYDYRQSTSATDCRCEKQGTAKAGPDHGEFLKEDPGTTAAGYRWISAELLFKAMQARTGGHGCNVIVFPDTEGVTWKCVGKGRIRATPSTRGRDLGPIPVGRTLPGGRTENGAGWKRADGTIAHGWVHVKYKAAAWGWFKGESVVKEAA